MIPLESRSGYECRFDLVDEISPQWFEEFVSVLRVYSATPEHDRSPVDCGARLVANPETRITFNSLDDWARYVRENWKDAAESDFWSSRAIIKRAVLDHNRQHLFLSVIAADSAAVDDAIQNIMRRLHLKPTSRQPYRYRRSSLEFEIGQWRPELFSAGINKIVTLIGPAPAIREAYVKTFEGDIERLISFWTAAEFVEFTGKRASRFGEAVLSMEARGVSIGIAVTADHKKLRIRTSMPPAELDTIIEAWPEQLKLKPTRAADMGASVSGSAPASAEKPLIKYGMQVLIAVIAAVSTAGLLNLHKAIWPDYTVIITSPSAAKGVPTFSPGTIPLNWYIKPEQTSFRSDRTNESGKLVLYGEAGLLNTFDAKPPSSINLRAGEYTIEINAPNARPSQVHVIIRPPSVMKPQKP